MTTNDLSTIKTAFISAIINKYNNPKSLFTITKPLRLSTVHILFRTGQWLK